MPCRVLLDQVAEAYATGDAAALKALYAEDALICSAALPDTVLTRDEMFAREDLLQRTALIGPIDLIPIDETAGLLRATVRTQTPGCLPVRGTCLAADVQGRPYLPAAGLESREVAADLYQRHGIDLDMNEPPH